jgi:SAM-dependent methyltransferase
MQLKIAGQLLNGGISGQDIKGLMSIQTVLNNRDLAVVVLRLLRMAAIAGRVNDILRALRELRCAEVYNKNFMQLLVDGYMAVLFPEGIDFFRSQADAKARTLKNGQFPYIPSGPECLVRLKTNHPDFFAGGRFIDIGCGIGDKVFLAEFLADDKMRCEGIEFDHTTHSIANHVLHKARLSRVSFHLGDAMEFDFGAYDRVYTYLPMDQEREKFYTHVWGQLPAGALWYEVSPDSWATIGRRVCNAKKVNHHLYRVPAKRKAAKKKEVAA